MNPDTTSAATRTGDSGDVSTAPNGSLAYAQALFDELVRGGLRHAVVCPGSRSAPLALAAAGRDALRVWPQIDERSAAFFALGLAKALREPVALVCTSGTAAANFLPAVVEAHYANVPLLVLTADRPPELRECGAGQTIDQHGLFGRHVRWFAETPVAGAGEPLLRHLRTLAGRGLAEAHGGRPGPVHLNLPFRDPLDPTPVPGDVPADLDPRTARGRGDAPWVTVETGAALPTPTQITRLADWIASTPRGLIACGPLDHGEALPAALTALAAAAGWPLLAEPTAQLRRGPHAGAGPLVAHSDLFLRDPGFAAAHAPQAVLRFGATPTSKSLRLWLEASRPERLVLVDPHGVWNEPSGLASTLLRVDPLALCDALAERLRTPGVLADDGAARRDWRDAFAGADRCAARAIERVLGPTGADAALLEAGVARGLAEALPEGALLYVSSSMPVRDLDAFLPPGAVDLRVLANRGANGIDGLVSSALGAAAAAVGPVVLLIGDLALLHDLGGLVAAHRHALPLAIVVVDNDGGGIFSFLPIAGQCPPAEFERLFRTPHGLDIGRAVTGLGLSHERISRARELRPALEKAFAAGGTRVIEVSVDRDENVEQHRQIARAVSEELARAAAGARP